MKTIYPLLMSLIITFQLNANSDNEFKYIQPIAVEEAPVVKAPEPVQEEVVIESVEEVQELDSDEDGVFDSIDECPDTSKGLRVDEVGCPKTAVLNVYFETDAYTISENYSNDINKFAEFLQENTGYNAIVYGHTDSTGSDIYNQTLSENRAISVVDALINLGVEKKRLSSVGKGESEPIANNKTKDGRAQNRRIEIELVQ